MTDNKILTGEIIIGEPSTGKSKLMNFAYKVVQESDKE